MEDEANTGNEAVVFDASAVSILQSVFKYSGDPPVGDGLSKTARVKFMITMQDEQDLCSLGYSQEQINKLTPQEAEAILQAGTKAEQGL